MDVSRLYCRPLIGALLVLAASLAAAAPDKTPLTLPSGRVLEVEVMVSDQDRALGLMFRKSLPEDKGMLFVFERSAFHGIWMKNCRFPIDIVWIRQARIVDLHQDVPFEPGGNGPTVRPRQIVDAVLEVPAGYAAASGWRIGDRVKLERSDDHSAP